jgi:hypothetical protein
MRLGQRLGHPNEQILRMGAAALLGLKLSGAANRAAGQRRRRFANGKRRRRMERRAAALHRNGAWSCIFSSRTRALAARARAVGRVAGGVDPDPSSGRGEPGVERWHRRWWPPLSSACGRRSAHTSANPPRTHVGQPRPRLSRRLARFSVAARAGSRALMQAALGNSSSCAAAQVAGWSWFSGGDGITPEHRDA